MERVVTINLNGNAYQLDETAFAALRAYLDQADLRLRNNPDRAEILADLEQAIGEKCGRFIGPHKTVVTKAEIDQVITEMGPVESSVESENAQPANAGATPTPDPKPPTSDRPGPKRLYRIREGKVFMGVCTGIAAYLHIDVVFVRIAFVVAIIATFGWGWLGYWILGFIIPEARTADELAEAHGQAPFNAQDVIDDARRAAESFRTQAKSTGREWRRQAREQRRQWRRQWRSAAWAGRPFAPGMAGAPPPGMFHVYSFVSFVAFIAIALAALSLVSTGFIWGWPLPDGMPVGVGVVLLALLFHVFTLPLRSARRAYRYGWDWHYAWMAMWDGVVGLFVLAFGIWLLLRHLPPTHNFHEFVQNVPEAIQGAAHEIAGWFR